MKAFKSISYVWEGRPQQVGDGFVGQSMIPSQRFQDFSPFLMLDHHGPMQVKPSPVPKGVDEHPHRGIETVTVVFEGALQHRDSAGNKGTIFAGDVQWMSAASGLVHEEKHEINFSRKGGTLDFVQLWVNLPRAHKMEAPRYQELTAAQIPVVQINEQTKLRLISGELNALKGPALTYTPVLLAEVIIEGSSEFELQLPENFNVAIHVAQGEIALNDTKGIKAKRIAKLSQQGEWVSVATQGGVTRLLILGGEPINEPIASYGPFVMNTQAEIMQTLQDYQSGKMGFLEPVEY
ncbi:pirin family protein [Runella sp. MFBS21]|uniref:pirin family protein n=1 Tax=Runella sp. MFBS21 TaxID=3034018 RepID=UPI0023F99524|nr:pirin family protein [Runella sp. MFBS21]MDF7816212.1 pirin family protein [Runella sp. MFBS21]